MVRIEEQKAEAMVKMKAIDKPHNLEKQAQILIVKDIYEKSTKGHTEKR